MFPVFAKWAVVLGGFTGSLYAQRLADMAIPLPLPPGSTLVIGFLGGFERWDDTHRSVRRLALELRQTPGVYAESIANRNRRVALKLIRQAFDTNHDGRLDTEERSRTRIILYGQSWGGAATLDIANALQRLGIAVLLTVQVDSVGRHDTVIPTNVLAAVNFYQRDPLTIQGRREIRAADPTKTRILGNFGQTYLWRPFDDRENASWIRRTFGGSHAKMELDPIIWEQVEQYILEAVARR